MITIQANTDPLTCIDSVRDPHNIDKYTDKLIFGDNAGNIMLLRVNTNDLSNTNKTTLKLDEFKEAFIKKRIHDEAVAKVKQRI